MEISILDLIDNKYHIINDLCPVLQVLIKEEIQNNYPSYDKIKNIDGYAFLIGSLDYDISNEKVFNIICKNPVFFEKDRFSIILNSVHYSTIWNTSKPDNYNTVYNHFYTI